MSTLEERAKEAKGKMETANPSGTPGRTTEDRKRIPLTLPQQRLEVRDIPGYHLHWFRGTPQRLQQAQNAGYVFVAPDEVDLNSRDIGGDASKTGNSDLGSRVSIIEGSEVGHDGQAVRLYLMKQKMEWYLADQKISQERNDSIAETLTQNYRTGQIGKGADGEQAVDAAQRYVDPKRTSIPSLFKRKG